MTKKRVIKRPVVSTPQNIGEATDFIRKIGEIERSIDRSNTSMNEQLEKVKESFVEQTKENQQQLNQLFEGLYAYAQANRVELTCDGKTKTVKLPTGSFYWRTTPKSVAIEGTKAVLAKLKKLGINRFIRTKEEVDKVAMLKEENVAVSIAGITIEQREEFVVKPAETKAQIAATAGEEVLKVTISSGPEKKDD